MIVCTINMLVFRSWECGRLDHPLQFRRGESAASTASLDLPGKRAAASNAVWISQKRASPPSPVDGGREERTTSATWILNLSSPPRPTSLADLWAYVCRPGQMPPGHPKCNAGDCAVRRPCARHAWIVQLHKLEFGKKNYTGFVCHVDDWMVREVDSITSSKFCEWYCKFCIDETGQYLKMTIEILWLWI